MGKKLFRRYISLCLACSLFVSLVAIASTLGGEVHNASVALIDDTVLSNGVYWNSSSSDFRTENYITYTPGGAVRPMIVYGSKVCNQGSFANMAALLQKKGYNVIGGINGDYYIMSNNQPLGIVVTEGVLRSSDGGHHAVGFFADGTAMIGKPALTTRLVLEDGNDYPIEEFNKMRNDQHIMLFSSDFAANTKNTKAGIDVVIRPEQDGFRGITIGSETRFIVEQVTASTGALTIPEGRFVLSLASTSDDWRKFAMNSLAVGGSLTITVTAEDVRWNNVTEAVGSLYRLVSDGQVVPGPSSDKGAASRTAVGIKPDGTLILYTIDGRQPGYSIGATITQVAERLIELGCTEATIMDGGGSTGLNAMYIGTDSLSQINSPSDGAPRSVSDYIMLVSTAAPTGVPYRLGISPFDTFLLAGASETFTVTAADSAGFAVALPAGAVFEADAVLGTISSGGVLRAGSEYGVGKVTISADGVIAGEATVTVIKTPTAISVLNEANSKGYTSIDLQEGQSLSLTATAHYGRFKLLSADDCFTWEFEGNNCEIDGNGNLKALKNGDGVLRVSAGELTLSVPVSVSRPNPFTDIKSSDWFFHSVLDSYESGLFNGISDTQFGPSETMNRAMFITVLGRMAGVDTTKYSTNAFSDVPAGSYYAPYVAWATAEGITTGYGGNLFKPGDPVTREQACTFLMRYLEYAGVAWLPGDGVLFADNADIGSWARPAVYLMKDHGIIEGFEANTFKPQGLATRAQVATILQRFLKAMV